MDSQYVVDTFLILMSGFGGVLVVLLVVKLVFSLLLQRDVRRVGGVEGLLWLLGVYRDALKGRCFCCVKAKPSKIKNEGVFSNMISCEHLKSVAKTGLNDCGCTHWKFDEARFAKAD